MKKKGQEEIVGFIMIIVLVSVILTIFLGISLRQKTPIRAESIEVYQFLASMSEYTSSCAIRFVPDYSSVSELFENCLDGNRCIDGKDSCDVLNNTLTGTFQKAWLAGNKAEIKGYRFKANYVTGNGSEGAKEEKIAELNAGNCTLDSRGAEYVTPAFPGRIVLSMETCY